jgi:hypothetical protein
LILLVDWSTSRLRRASWPRCLSHSDETATSVVARAATKAVENFSSKSFGITASQMKIYKKRLFSRVKLVGASGETLMVSVAYYSRSNTTTSPARGVPGLLY